MQSKASFKIIVIGGGVAGLTLANMLEKFDLDYVLLEAYDTIDAPNGAAIGLMPNGSLIMDQLGCYDAIRAAAIDGEIEYSHVRDSDGKSLLCLRHMLYHQEKRHGYPMIFFDRKVFLNVLYDQLRQKDRVRLSSRVKRIESMEGGVRVLTEDGRTYVGTIAIGADGIHSSVRQEMRRIADATDPRYFPAQEEDQVPCYYQCSFGIARNVDGWDAGEQCFTNGRGKSFLVVAGPGDRCYWFLFVRLPQIKYGKQITRYTKEDEARFVEEHSRLKIKEGLVFGQVYAKRLTSVLTPLHEVVYKKWFFDRVLLVGDSAHKPNPIGGMGANAAIETAAEFLNALLDTKTQRQNDLEGLTQDEIKSVFQRVQDARLKRARFIVSFSHATQALNAYERPLLSTFAFRVLMPLGREQGVLRGFSRRIVGASRLKHLDLPARPHILPYDHELPARPVGILLSWAVLGLFSFEMALLIYATCKVTKISHGGPNGWDRFAPFKRSWLGDTSFVDSLKGSPILFQFPVLNSNLALKWKLIHSQTQVLSPLLIYVVEGYRVGRQGTILSLPIIFMVGAQFFGLRKAAPLYALLSGFHSDLTPVDRAIGIHVARSLLPAVILSFILHFILSFASISDGEAWILLSPMLFSVLISVFSAILVLRRWRRKGSDDPSQKHPEWYSTEDVPVLKSAYTFAFVVQAATHLTMLAYTCCRSDSLAHQIFSQLLSPYEQKLVPGKLSGTASAILQDDLFLTIVTFASQNLYSVWELRRQGYITTLRALKAAAAVIIGQVLLGSGATWVGLWCWREDVIVGLSVSHKTHEASK